MIDLSAMLIEITSVVNCAKEPRAGAGRVAPVEVGGISEARK